MPPPSITFSSFPVFNFPETSFPHSPQRERVLLAQATVPGRPSRPAVVSDAPSSVVVAPRLPGHRGSLVPVYSLAELAGAGRERDRVFSDPQLLGIHFSIWDSARNTTYQNISLTILRMRYFLEGRQTDTFSIRAPLLSWVRAMRSSDDSIFRETFQRVREALGSFREVYNRERAERLIRFLEEVQRTVGGSGEGSSILPPTPPPPSVTTPEPPSSSAPSIPTPPPSEGLEALPTPREPEIVTPPPPPSAVGRPSPVSFTSTSRVVGDGDSMMRDLRDHAVRTARNTAERFGRRSGSSIDFTLRLHIQYNSDGAGVVMARSYEGGNPSLVQEILQAVARDLPRFRGHGGDALDVPLHFEIH